MSAALLIFVLSYAGIVVGKGRPAIALLGALAMIVFGVVGPVEALRQGINWDTILLLLGMMLISGCMAEAQLFRFASWMILSRVKTRPSLLVVLVFIAGCASALLLNDAICLMLTPLVLQIVLDSKLPPLPFLLALAFGSNAGSSATPTGNPQNMIIATIFGIPYLRFVTALFIPAAVSLVLVAIALRILCRKELKSGSLQPEERPALQTGLAILCLVTLTAVVIAFLIGVHMSWAALAGAAVLLIFGRRPKQVVARIDWKLLVFFAGLFVITFGVGKVGLAQILFEKLRGSFGTTTTSQVARFGLFTVGASQVVSNVPFVLLAAQWMHQFINPPLMCLSMALFSTLAGNLTTIGSVANLIVLEGSRDRIQVGFFEFLGYGLPITALTLLGGGGVLLLEQRIGMF